MKSIQIPGTTLAIATTTAFCLSFVGGSHPAIAHHYDPQSNDPHSITITQSPTPVTYLTQIGDPDQVVIQITEGEFRFHGYLKRTTGNLFIGEDEQVRVTYDRDAKRIVVINVQTGDEYYNYIFSETDEGAL